MDYIPFGVNGVLNTPAGGTWLICDCCGVWHREEPDTDPHACCPCGRLFMRMEWATVADLWAGYGI